MQGLCSLLTALFVGLKLTGHIDWSWWLVLLPVWIWLPIGALLLALYCWAKPKKKGLRVL